jgi:hypothetical protein
MFDATARTALRRAASLLLVGALGALGPIFSRSELIGYHEVKTDVTGRIVPWYGTTPGEAYDHVVRLVWDFLA